MTASDSLPMDSPAVTSYVGQITKRKASTDDSDDMAVLQTRKTRKRIPTDQWEAKRSTITKLYQIEKRPLKEVMEIIERDHGFKATCVTGLPSLSPRFKMLT